VKNKIWIAEEELKLYKTTAKEQSLEFTKKCMYMKKHKIRNMNDMFKILTLESYDRFTTDFLVMFHNILKAKEKMTEEEIKSVKLPYFEWVDDNECRSGYKFNGKEIIWTKDE